MPEVFAIYSCPICNDWSLEGTELVSRDEQSAIAREHLLECFGIPEELAS
jgi:hypothetical protein